MLYRFRMTSGLEATFEIADLDMQLLLCSRFIRVKDNGYVTRINLDNVTMIEELEKDGD